MKVNTICIANALFLTLFLHQGFYLIFVYIKFDKLSLNHARGLSRKTDLRPFPQYRAISLAETSPQEPGS